VLGLLANGTVGYGPYRLAGSAWLTLNDNWAQLGELWCFLPRLPSWRVVLVLAPARQPSTAHGHGPQALDAARRCVLLKNTMPTSLAIAIRRSGMPTDTSTIQSYETFSPSHLHPEGSPVNGPNAQQGLLACP